MKKILVLCIVMLMLAISVLPAFAKGSNPANQGAPAGTCGGTGNGFGVRAPYALAGTITALDAEGKTVTVSVLCGNRLAKPYSGQEMILQTTDATWFLLRNPDGTVTPISFNDLAVGQNVSSHGTLVNGTWTAFRVTSGARLSCLP